MNGRKQINCLGSGDWGGRGELEGRITKGHVKTLGANGDMRYLFFFKFYLFIYGCVGTSFLCEGFL